LASFADGETKRALQRVLKKQLGKTAKAAGAPDKTPRKKKAKTSSAVLQPM
jgi:hypothetical protein